MYVITGPTGNTGKVVAEHLLNKGQKVHVVGRSGDRLPRDLNGTYAEYDAKAFVKQEFLPAHVRPNCGLRDASSRAKARGWNLDIFDSGFL